MQQNLDLKTRIHEALENGLLRVLISDDQVSWTGAELRMKMAPLIDLIENNSMPGSRIGVCFPNSAVQALGILTAMYTKRIPVIISPTDLAADAADRLASAQLSMLVTNLDTGMMLENASVPRITLSRAGDVEATFLRKTAVDWMKEITTRSATGTGLILFTSGSTGRPKAVMVPEEGVLKTVDFLVPYFGLDNKTVAPIILPTWHSMGLNTQFLPTFLTGGHCHFMNSALGMNRAYRTILSQEGTFVALIGEVLRTCWEEKNRKNLPAAEHVKHVQLAGGMITAQHLRLAKDIFPNALIHKGYGLTEAIRATMINSRDPDFTSPAVGHPLPFVSIEIRNAEGAICGPMEQGEIFIKGPNVLLGVSGGVNQIVGKDGFLATGDMGYWNTNGQLCVAGRTDSLFKINGHRVSGHEIETLALETSDMIKNAKCLAIEDQRRAGQKMVLMLEVPADDALTYMTQGFQKIRNEIMQKFQALKHFPKEIFVVEQFPRTSNGKLALRQLNDLCHFAQKTLLFENSQSSIQFYRLPHAMKNGSSNAM